jgi:hypothetical protein
MLGPAWAASAALPETRLTRSPVSNRRQPAGPAASAWRTIRSRIHAVAPAVLAVAA